jgi:hypothetical protein
MTAKRTLREPRGKDAEPAPGAADYLRAPYRLEPLTALLLLATIFMFAADPTFSALFLLLAALGLLAFVRAPRWLCHLLAAAAVTVFAAQFVLSIANRDHDAGSVRDDAVETAAERLLAGVNPWTERGPLLTPITSGPASVLLATPAVALLGRVNEVSLAFYLAFIGFLAAADAQRRNGTFVPLTLLVVSGLLGFQHTLYWSLEELYWAYAALALAWLLVEKSQPAAAGVCLAFAFCSRASYAFPIFAFLCWWWNGKRPGLGAVSRLAAGAAAGTIAIAAPFLIVGGAEFLAHNPFTTAGELFSRAAVESNPLFALVNRVVAALGPAAGPLRIAAALAAIWLAGLRLSRDPSRAPFWHLTFGAFVADFLVHRGRFSPDYTLFFAIPAFLAAALSNRIVPPSTARA